MAQRDNYELVLENTRIVQEQAKQGGVITGRNGAMILASWPGALHVKLDGPLAQRIERAATDAAEKLTRDAVVAAGDLDKVVKGSLGGLWGVHGK